MENTNNLVGSKLRRLHAKHDMKTVEAGAGGNGERVFDMKKHLFLSE